jgi:TPR repeat protein
LKKARQGNAESQYTLGTMYELGEGVAEDDKEAFKWFSLAASQGNVK